MLAERLQKILFAVVQSYIQRPDPVGSRYVVKKYAFSFSPATVRNIMADLEEMGFLSQPHTSAGRVPTDRGYRLYVNHLLRKRRRAEERMLRLLRARLRNLQEDLEALLQGVARELSASSYLGVAAPARASRTTLNRIELFGYRGSRVAVVLISNEGLIRHRVIRLSRPVSPADLRRLSEYLNSRFGGWAMDEIRLRLVKEMSQEKAMCDMLISRALEICGKALELPEQGVFMAGMADFLGLPDFSSRIGEIARAIEDKHLVLRLLEELGTEAQEAGSAVLIGSENPVKEMRSLSIVAAPFRQEGRMAGTVGIIGPTRMDYQRAMTMVEATAQVITETLSGKES